MRGRPPGVRSPTSRLTGNGARRKDALSPMECLAAFVVLFVLPLAGAGVLLGWRAARAAKRVDREARAELGRLRERLAALEGGGEAARTAIGAARAADPAHDSSVAGRGGVAATPASPAPASGYAPAPAAEVPPSAAPAGEGAAPPLPPPPPRDAGRPAIWPAATTPSPPMPTAPPAPHVSLEERLGARLPVWVGAAALVLGMGLFVKVSFDRGWI